MDLKIADSQFVRDARERVFVSTSFPEPGKVNVQVACRTESGTAVLADYTMTVGLGRFGNYEVADVDDQTPSRGR